jgi:hypothetical protein
MCINDVQPYLNDAGFFIADYCVRPLYASATNRIAVATAQGIGLTVAPLPLRLATIVGAIAVSIIEKYGCRSWYRDTLAGQAAKEALQFAVVVPLSALIYDMAAFGAVGPCSLLIGAAIAYLIAKVTYVAVLEVLRAVV